VIGLSVLIALVLYVYLAKVTIQFVGKRAKSKLAKYLTIAMFVLIPTWDIIPGRVFFQHLCETEAGVKALKTVELDRSYFKPDGKPDDKKLAERYPQMNKFERNFSTIFHIAKTESTIHDKETGEVLGTAANFSYRGGWLTVSVLVDATGSSCPAYPSFGMHSAVLEKVFKPSAI
jgi:hypothetical protein